MRDSLLPEARDSLPSLSEMFEPLFELGHGGMGTVFLARMAGVGGFERLVVVKRMNPELLARADLVRRFLNEAKIASHVHHANVVGVQVIGHDQKGYFLVLDYVEGDSLESILADTLTRGERIPLPVLLRVLLDGLAGMHAIHEARDPKDRPLNILHRDVSTCNLLVGIDGVTRVTDFGVAKSESHTGQTGELLVGKALYMAPEYLMQKEVDRRIDVYAMGLVLWISLMGTDPWPESAPAQIMVRAISDGVPALPPTFVPPAIADVVAKACSIDPDQRFATAREMATALLRAATKSGIEIAEPFDVAALVEHVAGRKLADRRRSAGTIGSHAMQTGDQRGIETGFEMSPPPVSAAPPSIPTSKPARASLPPASLPRKPSDPPESVAPLRADVSRSISVPDLRSRNPMRVVTASALGALVGALVIGTLIVKLGKTDPASAADGPVVASEKVVEPPPPIDSGAPAAVASTSPPPVDSSKAKPASSTKPPSGRTPAMTTTTPAPPGLVPTAINTGNPYR